MFVIRFVRQEQLAVGLLQWVQLRFVVLKRQVLRRAGLSLTTAIQKSLFIPAMNIRVSTR